MKTQLLPHTASEWLSFSLCMAIVLPIIAQALLFAWIIAMEVFA